jgi:hypothetical protein
MRELTALEYLRVKARKETLKRLPKMPDRIEPDGWCRSYQPDPKAAFFTEGKAYKALQVSAARHRVLASEKLESRFYPCPFGAQYGMPAKHFHLTSLTGWEDRPENDGKKTQVRHAD